MLKVLEEPDINQAIDEVYRLGTVYLLDITKKTTIHCEYDELNHITEITLKVKSLLLTFIKTTKAVLLGYFEV
ncbi:hypothetical protein GGGNBK_11995 [Sporosarcina sp. ANT_H38]